MSFLAGSPALVEGERSDLGGLGGSTLQVLGEPISLEDLLQWCSSPGLVEGSQILCTRFLMPLNTLVMVFQWWSELKGIYLSVCVGFR